MASLKEIKSRISSVKSTRQITSAMKMVSSAKLHRAQSRIESMLPYQRKLNGILADFLSSDVKVDSVYTQERDLHHVSVVVFSSNTSLCGAFNSNIIKQLNYLLTDYASLGKEQIAIYPVGKKIEEAVKKLGYTPEGTFQTMAANPTYVQASELARRLMQKFVDGETDRVELVYYHFRSAGSQVLTRETFLPLDLHAMSDMSATGGYNRDYIVEPSASELVESLLPKVLCQKMFTVLADSCASEHAARMVAMQTATDNANDLIQDLTIQYNKGRQQAITAELLDIVGGSMK